LADLRRRGLPWNITAQILGPGGRGLSNPPPRGSSRRWASTTAAVGAATLAEASRRARRSRSRCCSSRLHRGDALARASMAVAALSTTAALIDHIERTHHVFTVEELARAEKPDERRCSQRTALPYASPGRSWRRRSRSSTQELARAHAEGGARALPVREGAWPRRETTGVTLARPPFQSARNPHPRDGRGARRGGHLPAHKLRALCSGYAPRRGTRAARSARSTRASASLERDLHQHIHLENNRALPARRRSSNEPCAAPARRPHRSDNS
jgi:hypothetical protein